MLPGFIAMDSLIGGNVADAPGTQDQSCDDSSSSDNSDAAEGILAEKRSLTPAATGSAPAVRGRQQRSASANSASTMCGLTASSQLFLTENGRLVDASGSEIEDPPVWVTIPRSGHAAAPLIIDGAVFLDLVSVYHILRGFSWLLRLSPFSLQDLCFAVASGRPSSLLDEVHLAMLRTLAAHEVAVDREDRRLDLAMLDQVRGGV